MNNAQFSKSFYFFECNFKRAHHTDNSHGTSCHHIGYIKSGSVVFDIEGEILNFSSGDVFYTPTGCKYHSYWSGECICYDSYAFTVFPSRNGGDFDAQKLVMTEKAWEILFELTENKEVSCKSVGLLYSLLYEVLPAMTRRERSAKAELCDRALSFMREDFSLSVPAIARKTGVSLSALYALFAEQLQSTPITEKNRIRAEKAVKMLQNTDLAVEEISTALGFSSAAYLRKILHTFYGKTPRKIRKYPEI